MSKRALLDAVIAKLEAELAALTQAALATHAEATDEENKAEDKYDTRGLEASYLAHGQSKAAEEAAQAVAQFRALSLRDFTSADPIGLGALVTLESKGARNHYLIGPRAGGTEIEHDGRAVLVVTPTSPLGRQVVGRKLGDTIVFSATSKQTISAVS
jgi:transcription elongation GreA/GreB family factor